MKKIKIETKYNDVYLVDIEDIKQGDCYDCGRPFWAWSIDNPGYRSSILDNVKSAARLKGVDIRYIDGYASAVVTADGVEHRDDNVTKLVEQLLDDETNYNDERGLPYIYAEIDGETIVIDSDEAWFVDADEADIRKLLQRREFADKVRDAREAAGLTQQQLSELSNVAQCNIAKLERGYYNASIDVLNRIATALDCELTLKKH